MFKFFDDRITIRILVESLSAYDPFYPYDDRHYSYHFKDNFFHVKVKFPYREDINEKYTLIYNVNTTDFDIEPNDIKIKLGSFTYKRIQKALKKACGHSLERTAFFNMVYLERQKMAEYITTESKTSGDSNLSSKGKHRTNKSNTSYTPSVRDAVWSSADDSSSSSSGSRSSNGCD